MFKRLYAYVQVSRKDLQETSAELVRTLESFVGTGKTHLTLLVNNLGGMTPLEMAAITTQVVKQMPSASYVTGTLMTVRAFCEPNFILVNAKRCGDLFFFPFSLSLSLSPSAYACLRRQSLDMRGFSITVLTSPSAAEDEEEMPDLLQLLAASTDSLAWPGLVVDPDPVREEIPEQVQAQFTHDSSPSNMAESSDQITLVEPKTISAIMAACEKLVDSQGLLNGTPSHTWKERHGEKRVSGMSIWLADYDSVAGDGDCGSTLSLGAQAILENLKQRRESGAVQGSIPLVMLLSLMGRSIRQAMGGSSGALLDIFFTAAAATLASKASPGKDREPPPSLAAALKDGLDAMIRYGGAAEGQRTMLDALVPAVGALEGTTGAPAAAAAAAAAAAKGADATKTLAAGAGRARYVPVASYMGQPDPGAAAVAIALEAFAAGVE